MNSIELSRTWAIDIEGTYYNKQNINTQLHMALIVEWSIPCLNWKCEYADFVEVETSIITFEFWFVFCDKQPIIVEQRVLNSINIWNSLQCFRICPSFYANVSKNTISPKFFTAKASYYMVRSYVCDFNIKMHVPVFWLTWV